MPVIANTLCFGDSVTNRCVHRRCKLLYGVQIGICAKQEYAAIPYMVTTFDHGSSTRGIRLFDKALYVMNARPNLGVNLNIATSYLRPRRIDPVSGQSAISNLRHKWIRRGVKCRLIGNDMVAWHHQHKAIWCVHE